METLAKQACWQGYLTRDGFVPERYSSQIHKWQIHEPVGGHHTHCVSQERDAVQHGVERDGVPGVVGQADQGVGAGGADAGGAVPSWESA